MVKFGFPHLIHKNLAGKMGKRRTLLGVSTFSKFRKEENSGKLQKEAMFSLALSLVFMAEKLRDTWTAGHQIPKIY